MDSQKKGMHKGRLLYLPYNSSQYKELNMLDLIWLYGAI